MAPLGRVAGLLEQVAADRGLCTRRLRFRRAALATTSVPVEDRLELDQAALEQERGDVVDVQHRRTPSRRVAQAEGRGSGTCITSAPGPFMRPTLDGPGRDCRS